MDAAELRQRLASARLYLLFTPELCGFPAEAMLPEDDWPGAVAALERLEAALPHADLVQVRPKPLGASRAPATARAAFRWTELVLERAGSRALVLVDDRVDVAAALAADGCAGVHLGRDDCPPAIARSVLGGAPLIGLSTHDAVQVAESEVEPVDMLGFGPVFATPTKGYARGLGPERAWVASQATSRPLFAIGGVTPENAGELHEVGRAAVGSAVLAAPDPGEAARAIAAALGGA